MTVYIEYINYKEFLNENTDFVNHLNNKKISNNLNDDLIEKEFNLKNNPNIGIGNAECGLYITDFFLKQFNTTLIDGFNNGYNFAKIYEDKEMIEKFKFNEKKQSETAIRLLNEDFERKVNAELNKKNNNQALPQENGFFYFIFPVAIFNNIFIIFLNCKNIPYEVSCSFEENKTQLKCTQRLDDNFINYEYFNVRLFHVKNTDNTYTDFIKEFYSNEFNNANFLEISKNQEYNITDDYFIKLNDVNNIMLIKKEISENIENKEIVTVGNYQNSQDNIVMFQGRRNKNDARYIYWEKCINNNSKFDEDNVLNITNYYDISFNCKNLKSFCFSNYTPGYYVLNYIAKAIYSQFEFNINQKVNIINLSKVYMEIFNNNIIKIKIDDIL